MEAGLDLHHSVLQIQQWEISLALEVRKDLGLHCHNITNGGKSLLMEQRSRYLSRMASMKNMHATCSTSNSRSFWLRERNLSSLLISVLTQRIPTTKVVRHHGQYFHYIEAA